MDKWSFSDKLEEIKKARIYECVEFVSGEDFCEVHFKVDGHLIIQTECPFGRQIVDIEHRYSGDRKGKTNPVLVSSPQCEWCKFHVRSVYNSFIENKGNYVHCKFRSE